MSRLLNARDLTESAAQELSNAILADKAGGARATPEVLLNAESNLRAALTDLGQAVAMEAE